mmetsp:Transcript_8845/g.18983  ORF Transcript_8845/g.18983 Transcript_8845/m.18983 type:complete len:184 (+) Transcript_8845:67-618(+)
MRAAPSLAAVLVASGTYGAECTRSGTQTAFVKQSSTTAGISFGKAQGGRNHDQYRATSTLRPPPILIDEHNGPTSNKKYRSVFCPSPSFAINDKDSGIDTSSTAIGAPDDGEDDMGVPLELESLQQQSTATFMGLEPLQEGEDPFDNGLPIVTSVIILCVSTFLTIAPFFMDVPDQVPPPPGM